MNLSEIQVNVSTYVKSLFNLQRRYVLFYHNIEHTIFMMKSAKELAKHEKLNEYGSFILETALWFYNVSYLLDGDVTAAAVLATDFLELQSVNDELTREIGSLIISMRHQVRSGFIEAIMYDSISFDFADSGFLITNQQLRLEKEALGQNFETEKEWLKEIISQMESHKYYTNYASLNWNPLKKDNLEILYQKLKALA